MGYATWHWRIYNVHRRLFGLALAAIGALFVGTGTGILDRLGFFDPGERITGAEALVFVLVGLVCAAVGVRICRARTYRPDLGDVSWWAGKAGGYDPRARRAGEPRSWWTGDPKQG